MNCINCKTKLDKCKNEKCNNYARRCKKCWYDYDKNCIDKLPYISYYSPLNIQKIMHQEYLSKQLESIACGKCEYITNLYLKYGENIPLVSSMYEDVKINVKFDKEKLPNNTKNQTLG